MQNSQTTVSKNDSWSTYTLGELCEIKTGKKDVNAESADGKYPFFTCAQDIHKIDTYTFDTEAVLVAGNGFFNVKYYKGKFDAYQRTYVLHNFKKGVDSRFLYYFITSKLKEITKDNRGSTIRYIRLGDLTEQEVLLPSYETQLQIVDKIESLQYKTGLSIKNVYKAKQAIQRFRNSILSAAVTGRLTESWRLEQKDYTSQNTMDLLLSNKKEWQTNNLKKNKNHIDEEDHDIDLLEPEDYPDNWIFSTIGQLADLVTDGEHITPNRTNSGYYLLSARNIQNGYIDLTKVDYIPEDEYIRITKRCNPQENDILISCSGSVGRVCRVPRDIKFTMVRSAALVKMQSNQWFSPYLELFLQSPQAQTQIYKLQKATAQANLFIGQIKKIIIPLPSIREQQLIVSKVNLLLDLITNIEAEIDKAEKKADKLTQSILSKAFRGDL